ncbi:MAG: hypothetical protein NT099_06540 [Candidatus Saganbacteria bacterium]|nr:hypothetical protein [Candidatus Saganbacteria bacterium]
MPKTRSVSGIKWGTPGTGRYEGQEFRDFFRQMKLFEMRRGFFSRAFGTIVHGIRGIKVDDTRFLLRKERKSDYVTALDFKKVLFAKETSVRMVMIMLAAVKAYVMEANKRGNDTIYWKAEGGHVIERRLLWVNLTPLRDLEKTAAEEIKPFRESHFYARLWSWMQMDTMLPNPDPEWVTDYMPIPLTTALTLEERDFYQRVIAWMEAKGMLEYQVIEAPKPPPIPPPVTPPSKPRQRELF